MLEGIYFCRRVGEISHLFYHHLRLLGHHRETSRRARQSSRAISEELQSHAAQKLAAMLELRLGIGTSLFQVGDNSTLTLEMSEAAHALLARTIVKRVCLRLEIVDLALDGLRRVTRIPQVELCKCSRDLHCFAIHGVRRFTDVGNYLSLTLRHSHDLPLNLVAVGSDLSQS